MALEKMSVFRMKKPKEAVNQKKPNVFFANFNISLCSAKWLLSVLFVMNPLHCTSSRSEISNSN